MRILLVEDDEKTAESVTATLSGAGYVVDHEGDGEEAWFNLDSSVDHSILKLSN